MNNTTLSQKKWIVLIDTLVDGTQPAYHDIDGNPCTHDSLEDAQKEMLSDWLDTLSDQVDEFKKGLRDFDEVDEQCDMWVEECQLSENGSVILEDGRILVSHHSH